MDLRTSLGANLPAGSSQVTLFVPSVDRYGSAVDRQRWVDEALTVFARLFRGATAFPPGRGVWRDDDRGGELVFDEPVMVTSYVDPDLLESEVIVRQLRAFLHRMGREANQGEVGVVIDQDYLPITEFDEVDEGEG
jgi:hypothetical protein